MKATLDFAAKTIELEGSPTLADIRILQESLVGWEEWKIQAKPEACTASVWQTVPKMQSSTTLTHKLNGFSWSGHTGLRKTSNPDAFPKPTGAKTL